jgi:SAM-dependent methyltransferase
MMMIARFNWPFYAGAGAVFIASACALIYLRMPLLRLTSGLALAASAYFLFVSLGVSHLVYDRSDLYRWRWLERALRDPTPSRGVFAHAGFDEASQAVREKLGEVDWIVLDHYDSARMTEPSIGTARRMFPPTAGTLPAPFDQWPVASESVDVVFALLAVHELRTEAERSAWFAEAKRCLRTDGRVVVAEHTRDAANFLAFGPGFLHFHSPASWRRCWQSAGFHSLDEFRVTLWVRIFVLTLT